MANKFLEDNNGNKSSKRLGFLTSLVNVIAITWISVGYLFYKEQYQYGVDLIQISWVSTLGFAGVVASEFFAKNRKSEDQQ